MSITELLWYYGNIPYSWDFQLVHTFLLTCTPGFFFSFHFFSSVFQFIVPPFPWWWPSLDLVILTISTLVDFFWHIPIVPNFLMLKYVAELSCTLSDWNLRLMPFPIELYFLHLVKCLVVANITSLLLLVPCMASIFSLLSLFPKSSFLSKQQKGLSFYTIWTLCPPTIFFLLVTRF